MGDRLDESLFERLAPVLLAFSVLAAAALIAFPQVIVLLTPFLF